MNPLVKSVKEQTWKQLKWQVRVSKEDNSFHPTLLFQTFIHFDWNCNKITWHWTNKKMKAQFIQFVYWSYLITVMTLSVNNKWLCFLGWEESGFNVQRLVTVGKPTHTNLLTSIHPSIHPWIWYLHTICIHKVWLLNQGVHIGTILRQNSS